MRVLHIISTTDPAYGGPVESVAQLGTHLKRLGASVEVVACADAPGSPWIERYPLPVHAVGPGFGSFGYSARLNPWLRAHGTQYDVWVINGIWQYHASAAARTAKRLGMPYLIYTHGMLDPWSRRAHPFKYLKKLVYWSLLEQWTLRGAAAVCFTADEESKLARTYFPFGAWNAYVVGAGIAQPPDAAPDARTVFIARFPELEGKRLWLFLSRLHPKKGLDILLRSFAEVAHTDPALHLLIVGQGVSDFVASIRRLVGQLSLGSRVSIAGPLYGADKWMAYRNSELFILPSHQENFGIVIAEALAAGLPVCISNRINIWREVANAKAGLICKDSQPSLTAALRQWLALSGDDRAPYVENAKKCFRDHFQISAAAGRLLLVLEAVAEERAIARG